VNALTKASKLLNIFSKEKVILKTTKQAWFIVPQVRIKLRSGVAFEAAAVFSKEHSPQKK
jgi:hypothetical protein